MDTLQNDIKSVITKVVNDTEKPFYPTDIKISEIEKCNFNAYKIILDSLTSRYSEIYGTPARTLDVINYSWRNSFLCRIIIYQESRVIVSIDRIAQMVIPFDSIIGFNTVDCSEQKRNGYISEAYGIEINTNNLYNPTLFCFFEKQTNSLTEFSGILNIIMHDAQYKNDPSAKVQKEDINLSQILVDTYPDVIEISTKYEEDFLKEKEELREKENVQRQAQNGGCMVIFAIVASGLLAACCCL